MTTGQKIFIIIVIGVITLFVIVNLSSTQTVLKTPEGTIPRKLVVRKDDTDLYISELLKSGSQKEAPWQAFYIAFDRIIRKFSPIYHNSKILHNSFVTAKQWQIFYLFDEAGDYFLISRDIEQLPKNPFFIKKADVIEWNSYICLTYKNYPHQAKRDPIITYKTFEGAKKEKGKGVMIEKQIHGTDFSPSNAEPILKAYDNSIFYVVSLYDDIDEDGDYVFLGNYASGYVKYSENAHEFRRYVSKRQLNKQLLYITGLKSLAKPNMNPTELDRLYGPLSDLLADFGNDVKRSVRDILRVFQSGEVPSELQGKDTIFDKDRMTGRESGKIRENLNEMANAMNDYLQKNWLWNEDGYAYIPAEWMEER